MTPPRIIILRLVGLLILADQARFISTTSIIGDTKLWIPDTNLKNVFNWRHRQLPCINSIDRRIIIEEENAAIVIPSGIRSLSQTVLPDNGLLLFDDQDNRTLDDTTIENNCQIIPEEEQEDFVFSIANHYKSWFNPTNWKSSLYKEPSFDPHSHQIPCWQDRVLLGDERSGFKIDFNSNQTNARNDLNIRISELVINKIRYDNEQLSNLMQSSDYHNLLFNVQEENENNNDLLIIDHSSLNDNGYCMDDAGCICGNEDKKTMQKICSFVSSNNINNDDDRAPCDDPIYSTGYCNKICATVLEILIMPSKFQAKYLENFISSELYAYDDTLSERRYANKVHVVSRRVHDNKFEVTFLDRDGATYGTAHELATSIQTHLLRDLRMDNNYGVRTVSLRYSSQWRLGRTGQIWNILLIGILMMVSIYFVYDWFRRHRRPSSEQERTSFVRFSNDTNDQVEVFYR